MRRAACALAGVAPYLPSGPSCADWTSSKPGDNGRYGNVSGNGNGNGWSGGGDDSCDFADNLYCFER